MRSTKPPIDAIFSETILQFLAGFQTPEVNLTMNGCMRLATWCYHGVQRWRGIFWLRLPSKTTIKPWHLSWGCGLRVRRTSSVNWLCWLVCHWLWHTEFWFSRSRVDRISFPPSHLEVCLASFYDSFWRHAPFLYFGFSSRRHAAKTHSLWGWCCTVYVLRLAQRVVAGSKERLIYMCFDKLWWRISRLTVNGKWLMRKIQSNFAKRLLFPLKQLGISAAGLKPGCTINIDTS